MVFIVARINMNLFSCNQCNEAERKFFCGDLGRAKKNLTGSCHFSI